MTGQFDLLDISGFIIWSLFKCTGQYNRNVEGSRIRISVIKHTNKQKQQMVLKASKETPAFFTVSSKN